VVMGTWGNLSLEEAFLTNLKIRNSDDCWIWYRVDIQGYGVFVYRRIHFKAHRLMYSMFYQMNLGTRDIVAQLCGEKSCVNPAHLYLRTKSDVIRERFSKKKTHYDIVMDIINNPITNNECVKFPGKVAHQNYGRMTKNGQWFTAHILVWEMTNGPVPEGMEVCHSCDNSWCIQISHLYVATHQQNVRDMVSRGRHFLQRNPNGAVKGSRHGRSKLKEEQVLEIRKLYDSGKYKQIDLALMFSIHKQTVNNIVRRQKWTHI